MRTAIRRLTTIVASCLVMGLGYAIPASAYTCPLGNACFYGDLNYTTASGLSHQSATYGNLTRDGMNNKATSIAANGKQCEATHFYDAADRQGSFLRLNSEYWIGHGFRDPDLRNGAGDSVYKGWNYDDRISAWAFTFCYH